MGQDAGQVDQIVLVLNGAIRRNLEICTMMLRRMREAFGIDLYEHLSTCTLPSTPNSKEKSRKKKSQKLKKEITIKTFSARSLT